MQRGKLTKIIPIALVVIIIIIAISAIVSLGQSVFRGGSNNTQPNADVGREALLNTGVDRSVRMTVRGPIVADENFRSYRIAVSPSSRTATTYGGYLQTTIEMKSFDNNTKAYDEFVHALDRANAMKGTAFEGDKDDTRGICATGTVYEFETVRAGQAVKRLWTSTCSGSKGSLEASTTQLKNLFVGQIPEGDALIRSVRL
jgi:hypothetical protein